MYINFILFFIITIILFIFVDKKFLNPLKIILKLIGNSIIGGILIYIINIIGEGFDFHVGLNFMTSIFVGLLGMPGAAFLVIFKLII